MAKTDIGPPDYHDFLPEVIKKNYGHWKYHEILKPGVLVHVAESGDKIWSVRIGGARLICTDRIREYADIAEKYCDGHLRFTSRHNCEFLVSDERDSMSEHGQGISGKDVIAAKGWLAEELDVSLLECPGPWVEAEGIRAYDEGAHCRLAGDGQKLGAE